MSTEQTTAGEIFRLIPKVMADIGVIGKDRKNDQQGYKFRGIDDVYAAVQPAFVKHGIFVIPEVTDQIREERQTKHGNTLLYTILRVRHTFYAPDGSSVQAVTVGEAMDSGDKSANKAMSAAMKYACLEVFAIPTEGDNDTENQSHELAPQRGQQQQRQPAPRQQNPAGPKATPEQVKELKDLLGIVRLPDGTTKAWFQKAGVSNLEDLPAETIAKCIAYTKNRLPAVNAA